MENINWVCVFKTIRHFEADALKGNIESAGIPCVMMNKQDSSYLSMIPGMVELHVPDTQADLALKIIHNEENKDVEANDEV